MYISQWSVKRPVATIMCLMALLILGFLLYPRMPVNLLPQLNFPMAVVLTSYSEAGPEEIEQMVTRPVEEAVGTTSGVENISSTSYEEFSMVMVEFSWGTDMDMATLEMRERLDMVKDHLPSDISSPQVVKADPSLMPVMFISAGWEDLESDSVAVSNSGQLQMAELAGQEKLSDLERVVSDQVAMRLERIKGVSSVELSGATNNQVMVDLKREKMNDFNIESEQVFNALSSQNINYPSGRIVEDNRELLVRSLSEIRDLDDLRKTTVGYEEKISADDEPDFLAQGQMERASQQLNHPVQLQEVANVEQNNQTDSLVRLNGNPALGLIIQKQSDANTVQVTREIDRALTELEQEFDELVLMATWDQGDFIEQVLNVVKQNAIVGGILAAIVLFLFLRNIKSTLIIAISIPASVLITFSLGYFSGLTLNIITLSGLALGIGMLVDNSVVVLESIFRHAESGKNIAESALAGTEDVSSPIAASTLTTVVVFLPVFLLEGLAGVIFSELSYMVIFSLLISLLIALTIVPLLAVLLLRRGVKKIPSIVRLQKGYQKGLSHCRKRAKPILLVAAILTLGAGALLPFMGGEFLPAITRTEFAVDVQLPVGSSLYKTEQVVTEVEDYLSQFDEVDTIYSTVGERATQRQGGGYNRRQPHRGELMVILQEDRQSELVKKVEREFRSMEGANISASTLEGDLEFSGGSVEIDIIGSDHEKLLDLSSRAMSRVSNLPEVSHVSRNLPSPRPEIQILPNSSESAGFNGDANRAFSGDTTLTPVRLAQDVETNLTGRKVTVYRREGEEIPVVMGYFSDGPASPEELEERYSHTAEIKRTTSAPVINRLDGERHVTLSVDTESRDIRSVVGQIRSELSEMDMPDNYRVNYGGSYEDMWASYSGLGGTLILSLLGVYMVMSAQFESLKYPLVIMISIPFALVGVILFLFIIGDTLNVASIMGAIILSGLVVNNAIVLLDCIQKQRSVEQGAVIRLRPILMTSITTLLALIPMALADGPGSEIQNSLAFSLMGGLMTGTILTLLLLPLIVGLVEKEF